MRKALEQQGTYFHLYAPNEPQYSPPPHCLYSTFLSLPWLEDSRFAAPWRYVASSRHSSFPVRLESRNFLAPRRSSFYEQFGAMILLHRNVATVFISFGFFSTPCSISFDVSHLAKFFPTLGLDLPFEFLIAWVGFLSSQFS